MEERKPVYRFDAVIEAVPKDGAFVRFPCDGRKTFGKGRGFVRATFDGVPYEGSLVNMGVKNPDGTVCMLSVCSNPSANPSASSREAPCPSPHRNADRPTAEPWGGKRRG